MFHNLFWHDIKYKQYIIHPIIFKKHPLIESLWFDLPLGQKPFSVG